MSDLLAFFRSGGITGTIFIIFFILSIISMIASGKVSDIFKHLFTLCIVYLLTIYDSLNIITDYGPSLQTNICISSVPFLPSIAKNAPSILSLIQNNFPSFSQEILGIFILSSITVLVSEITKPLVNGIASFVNGITSMGFISFILSWVLRFFFCNVAAIAYLMFYVFVVQFASATLLSAISYVIFTLTLIVLLTPIIEYLIVAVDLIPLPVLKNISKFVKERKLGGNLQVVFFATFILCSLLIFLQLCEIQLLPDELGLILGSYLL